MPVDDAPFLLDVTRLIWRRWVGRYPTGIDRVALAYLRHFGDRAQAVIQHQKMRRILSRSASRDLFAILLDPGKRFRASFLLAALRNFAGLDDQGRGRFYFNVGHTGLNSAGFREWVGTANVRPIYLVHDLIPITHPEFCREGEGTKHRERMITALKTGAGIIGNSQATLDDLAAFATEQNLVMPPSLVAWLGIDARAHAVANDQEQPATFVTLGTIEARKNHLLLLNLWSRLIDRMGSSAPRLVIIGQRGWEAEPVFDLLDNDQKLRGQVTELNHCSDAELDRLLGQARALLFPSLAEGYGLPLLEALDIGLPVIASDLPVFREIAGEIPDFAEKGDADRWEELILSYAEPQSRARAAQLKRAANFHAPDWPSHFSKVEHWLDTLASSRDARSSI